MALRRIVQERGREELRIVAAPREKVRHDVEGVPAIGDRHRLEDREGA
jgi:hypothetical protein